MRPKRRKDGPRFLYAEKLDSICSFCQLVSDLGVISYQDWMIITAHLVRDHGLKPYFIQR